jgi:hypothetical protein
MTLTEDEKAGIVRVSETVILHSCGSAGAYRYRVELILNDSHVSML